MTFRTPFSYVSDICGSMPFFGPLKFAHRDTGK